MLFATASLDRTGNAFIVLKGEELQIADLNSFILQGLYLQPCQLSKGFANKRNMLITSFEALDKNRPLHVLLNCLKLIRPLFRLSF